MKSQIEIQPETNYRGYQRLGANVTRYDGGFARDFHEAIDLYREVDARQLHVRLTCASFEVLVMCVCCPHPHSTCRSC